MVIKVAGKVVLTLNVMITKNNVFMSVTDLLTGRTLICRTGSKHEANETRKIALQNLLREVLLKIAEMFPEPKYFIIIWRGYAPIYFYRRLFLHALRKFRLDVLYWLIKTRIPHNGVKLLHRGRSRRGRKYRNRWVKTPKTLN